ncbi:MAG: hypothetical protein ABIE47_02335 [Pseudomonadota bacterium]|uniref:Uncharacterized protein n=1 Tax=viral metagenome TaxID=1070528 RepID=A0A6M3JZF3_9ZZZZ
MAKKKMENVAEETKIKEARELLIAQEEKKMKAFIDDCLPVFKKHGLTFEPFLPAMPQLRIVPYIDKEK